MPHVSQWRVQLPNNGKNVLEVLRRSVYLGDYQLLDSDHCARCSYPGFKEDGCGWHNSDVMDRTYAMGAGSFIISKHGTGSLLIDHVLNLKTQSEYSIPIGKGMSVLIESRMLQDINKYEIVVPIPCHKSELKVDSKTNVSYNQSELLATMIAREAGLRLLNPLIKTQARKQRGGDLSYRHNIPSNLYQLANSFNKEELSERNILLVDDVRTSGSTGSACATVLKNSGANLVSLYVAGREVIWY